MTEYTVTLTFKASYETTIRAESPGAALDAAKDELRMNDDIIVTEFVNTEVEEDDIFGGDD